MDSITYKAAGVDVEAGNQAVRLMKQAVRSTYRPEVLGDVGGFGGLITLPHKGYSQPVLVAGTDGVGTKLMLAIMADKHDTIGIDCVAMCVNDVLVQGAEPLFFLDYIACGRLVPEKIATLVGGVAEGCRQAGCALIGGETAEMPGMYGADDYDLAGFAVGVADREALIDGSTIQPGDALIALASSGLHSNGYSLVRKLILEVGKHQLSDVVPEVSNKPLGEVLLTPTRIYVRSVLQLMQQFIIKGMAHITGGGLTENVPRMLPDGCGAALNLASWTVPPVFRYLEKLGNLTPEESHRTFNMGIGLVLVVPQAEAAACLEAANALGEQAWLVGEVVSGAGVNYREG
ncbi:MAG TPA: phosphoribosylformylglycinamidine cyclo-ligase [Firmicutes bacterium]|nr:phosphoribosylformylglycinamidine cyclo-ligase [Bacillota bacterium]